MDYESHSANESSDDEYDCLLFTCSNFCSKNLLGTVDCCEHQFCGYYLLSRAETKPYCPFDFYHFGKIIVTDKSTGAVFATKEFNLEGVTMRNSVGSSELNEETIQTELECTICLLNISVNSFVGEIDCCKHQFCANCIQEWANKHSTCPYDRKQFRKITVTDRSTGQIIRTQEIRERDECNYYDFDLDSSDDEEYAFEIARRRLM